MENEALEVHITYIRSALDDLKALTNEVKALVFSNAQHAQEIKHCIEDRASLENEIKKLALIDIEYKAIQEIRKKWHKRMWAIFIAVIPLFLFAAVTHIIDFFTSLKK